MEWDATANIPQLFFCIKNSSDEASSNGSAFGLRRDSILACGLWRLCWRARKRDERGALSDKDARAARRAHQRDERVAAEGAGACPLEQQRHFRVLDVFRLARRRQGACRSRRYRAREEARARSLLPPPAPGCGWPCRPVCGALSPHVEAALRKSPAGWHRQTVSKILARIFGSKIVNRRAARKIAAQTDARTNQCARACAVVLCYAGFFSRAC